MQNQAQCLLHIPVSVTLMLELLIAFFSVLGHFPQRRKQSLSDNLLPHLLVHA